MVAQISTRFAQDSAQFMASEKRQLFEKLLAKLEELKQTGNINGYTDGQEPTPINSEPTINIEVKIDYEKSDEQLHQFIESVETENYVDNLLQAQQKPQHSTVEDVTVKTIIQVWPQPQSLQISSHQQQPKSGDSPIKM